MALSSSELSTLLSDAKQHLNISSSTDDAELTRKLEAAVELVEAEVGPLELLSATETLDRSGVLRYGPVQSVTAATFAGADVLSSVVLNKDAGIVTGVYPGTVVTYTYGRSVPTAAQRHVLVEMVRRAWRGTQQGGVPGFGGGGGDTEGLPPVLMLTRADLANLKPTALFRGVVA